MSQTRLVTKLLGLTQDSGSPKIGATPKTIILYRFYKVWRRDARSVAIWSGHKCCVQPIRVSQLGVPGGLSPPPFPPSLAPPSRPPPPRSSSRPIHTTSKYAPRPLADAFLDPFVHQIASLVANRQVCMRRGPCECTCWMQVIDLNSAPRAHKKQHRKQHRKNREQK